MEIIAALLLFAAVMLAAVFASNRMTRPEQSGPTVAEIQARLAAEARTFVPVSRRW